MAMVRELVERFLPSTMIHVKPAGGQSRFAPYDPAGDKGEEGHGVRLLRAGLRPHLLTGPAGDRIVLPADLSDPTPNLSPRYP